MTTPLPPGITTAQASRIWAFVRSLAAHVGVIVGAFNTFGLPHTEQVALTAVSGVLVAIDHWQNP